MSRTLFKTALVFLAFVSCMVWADDNSKSNGGSRAVLADAPKTFKAECASCHTAYPPGLLAAKNWQVVMQSLDKHYGVDASLTPAEVSEVSTYLLANASKDNRHVSDANPPRLTKTAWFERKHRKVPAAAWADLRIKSASNCVACHRQAEKGSFSERDISVPGYPGKHW